MQGGALPVRYLAPESLEKGRYSEGSDVWAFGVMCWELLTHGTIPHCDITADDNVVAHVRGGGRLSRPTDDYECPDRIWEIVTSCWVKRPKDRPPFAELGISFAINLVNVASPVPVCASAPPLGVAPHPLDPIDRPSLEPTPPVAVVRGTAEPTDVKENEAVKAKVEAEKVLKQAEETAQQLKALKANNEAKEIERKAETVKRFEEEQQRRKQVAQLERKLKQAEAMTVWHRDEVQSFDDIWNVKIPRFHIRDVERGKPFVVFEVKVWLRGEEWKVFRRYSQFQQLHRGFKKQKALELVMKTISFPGSHVFKSFDDKMDPEFLKTRRQALERYIQEVIQKTLTSPASVFYRTNKKKVQRDSSFFNNAAALDLGP